MTATEIDATIYALYPRKVGRVAAMKAIAKAVKVVQKERACDPLEARRILYRATQGYARSPAGNNPDRTLIPHPATWFNRGSYFDDPQEWQHGGSNGQQKRTSAAAERGIFTRSNIAESFTRRHPGIFGADDGGGAGGEAESSSGAADGGPVRDPVGRDGAEVRAGDIPGRVIEGVV